MVELSDCTAFALPPADHMATAVTDSLNYLDTKKGWTGLNALHSSLTAAGIGASNFPTEAALTTDGPDGVRAIAIGNETATFVGTRKVVLSLSAPLPLLYATTLQKITIHVMPDPINPRVLRICRLPKPTLEAGEVLPPKPILHTQAALNRTDLATGLVEAATWTSSGFPLPKIKSRTARHQHITERHKIIFTMVALYAHGVSLIGGSAKITPPVNRSSCLARAIDKLLRLHTSARNRTHALHEDSTSQPIDTTDVANTADRPHHLPATTKQPNDHTTVMKEDTQPTGTPTEAPWQLVRCSKRRPQDPPTTLP
jgi:hypothetical protein